MFLILLKIQLLYVNLKKLYSLTRGNVFKDENYHKEIVLKMM